MVHNQYVVAGAAENRLIQMESTPSIVRRRDTAEKIAESNTCLRYDFEPT